MITKAQASRMRKGYELWHITARSYDMTPRRCYVQTYTSFSKRRPGAFLLVAHMITTDRPNQHAEQYIDENTTEWVRPCDWHAACVSYAIDNNKNVPPYKLKKAQLRVMIKGQPYSKEMG